MDRKDYKKTYWKGSHYEKMVDFVDGVLGKGENT